MSRSAGHTLVWPHWVTGNGDTSSIMVQVPPVLGAILPLLLPMSAMSACRDDDWRRTANERPLLAVCTFFSPVFAEIHSASHRKQFHQKLAATLNVLTLKVR